MKTHLLDEKHMPKDLTEKDVINQLSKEQNFETEEQDIEEIDTVSKIKKNYYFNFISYQLRGINYKFKIMDLSEEDLEDQKVFTIVFLADKKFAHILQENLCTATVILGKQETEINIFPYSTAMVHGYNPRSIIHGEDYFEEYKNNEIVFECIAYSKEIQKDVEEKFNKICEFNDIPKINIEDEL